MLMLLARCDHLSRSVVGAHGPREVRRVLCLISHCPILLRAVRPPHTNQSSTAYAVSQWAAVRFSNGCSVRELGFRFLDRDQEHFEPPYLPTTSAKSSAIAASFASPRSTSLASERSLFDNTLRSVGGSGRGRRTVSSVRSSGRLGVFMA